MEKVPLVQYGGVIQTLLAEIMNKRRGAMKGSQEQYSDIPPRDFFAYIAKHPLPEVEYFDRWMAEKVNEIIRFINKTDDALNLKRAINYVLKQSGNNGHCPFAGDNYSPDRLEIDDRDE